MTTKETMSLAQKLARIGKEIGAVSKSGTNVKQKYNYIEYGVVAGKIRELFDQYGIIIIPSVVDYKTDEITSQAGGRGYHYVLRMAFKLINGENPEDTMDATWLGESADFGDKGVNKAETSGTKYFLMRLFNVSEKGEEEADKYTPEIASTKRVVNYAPVMSEAEFTADEICEAKSTLESADSFEDLKLKFARLGKIRNLPEIVALKNKLKQDFLLQDVDVATENAKDVLAQHFDK